VAIKGSLKEASLADVCQLLAMGQKTGCLSVTDRSKFGQIFFERGRITYARIVNRRDRLGDLLVREGALTQQQLMDVLERQSREPDKRVGELLVDSGLITTKDLERYIRIQIEEAIYHLFTWSRGSFYFEVEERPDASDLLVSINPESLLLEAARRVDEWSLIEKKIQSLDLLFEVERQRLETAGVELTPEQQKIVPLLDGSRSVQDLVDDTGLGEFDTGKALFGLIQAGFAHRVGQQRSDAEPGRVRESDVAERRNLGVAFYKTGMLEDAAREFYRVLEVDPADTVARYHLALVSLREMNFRQAVRQLKALIDDSGPRFGAFVNLAFALLRLGRGSDALLVLQEAEKLRPLAPEPALLRGRVQLDNGEAVAALVDFADYRKRLGEDGEPSIVYYYYASLASALSRNLVDAEATAREGLERHPNAAPLLLMLGAVAERRGELENAEKYYRQAADELPSLVQTHKNLGDLAYKRGLHEEAVEHYKRAIDLEPKLGDDVYSKLGNLHYKRSLRDEAVVYWRRALELNPGNQVVKNNLEIVGNAG
jgi:tetratricopeptide (TPR) repeat protein